MRADADLQETICRRDKRAKKPEPHADGGHAQQHVPQQHAQDLLVPEADEEMEDEDEYEGMADMVESSDDEETNHGPAASIHSPPTAPQSSGSPVSKDEPESKRQRIQRLENVIDKVLGGLSDADKSLCDREKFKTMLNDLDEEWTG